MPGDSFLSDPSRKRKRVFKGNLHQKKGGAAPQAVQDADITSDSNGEADSDEENKASTYERPDGDISSEEEFFEESVADKRRRLAKQYLQNLKEEEIGGADYDAADLDNELLSRRLQEDVAENKGRMHKFIASKIEQQLSEIRVSATRVGSKNVTGVAVRFPYIYTVSKDMELIKWLAGKSSRPQRVKHNKGGSRFSEINRKNPAANHHCDQIYCVAASPDGKYVVTGGSDGRLIIWSSENLSCLKVLETRAAVNSLAFRKGSDQLYAACSDLRIRTYSVAQHAQVEILYGHQDNICDISALTRECCVSVGSRDKTAMYWKIAEESRLTFRGGDSDRKRKSADDTGLPRYSEGSIEAVSMIDETHFVTGSDNGNVSFWSLGKKKALFTQNLAHGLLPRFTPSKASAEASPAIAEKQIPPRQPYWITSVYAVPYSDLFLTGSSSGEVKLWRVETESFKSFSLVGILSVKGCVVKIDGAELSEQKKLVVYIATSKEHRLGRWLDNVDGRNGIYSVEFAI